MTRSIGPFFFTESESAHTFETLSANELFQFLKVLLRFAWEANHHGGAYMNTWHLTTYFRQELLCLLTTDMPKHAVEHVVRGMLQCKVKILADIRIARHYRQQIHREIVRISIVQTQPIHTRNIGQMLNQFSDIVLPIEVVAITCQVLGNKLELMHTLADQLLHFVNNLIHRTTLVDASDERYSTIGTMTITTLPYLHISVM